MGRDFALLNARINADFSDRTRLTGFIKRLRPFIFLDPQKGVFKFFIFCRNSTVFDGIMNEQTGGSTIFVN